MNSSVLAAHRVLVIGDVMLDRYIVGTVSRSAPESSAPVLAETSERIGLGGAGNVAANLAGLGAQVSLLGRIGEDREGESIRRCADRLGVNAHLLVTPAPTTVKTRFLRGTEHLLRWDREFSEDMKEPRGVLDLAQPLLSAMDCVVLSDYRKGLLSGEVLQALLSLCRGRGLPLIVDPKRADFRVYRGCTLLTPNLAEARRAAGLSDGAEVSAIGRRLSERVETAVLITQGEAGMTLFADGRITHQSALGGAATDVCGAGDAVVAAMAMVAAAGCAFEEGLSLAATVGSLAVQGPGANPVDREAVALAMRSYH